MSDPKASRMVSPERRSDDVGDTALHPQSLSDFVGQAQARKNLSIFIEAARKSGEALDHVLFVGPPGLGKTTLIMHTVERIKAHDHVRALVAHSSQVCAPRSNPS